MSQRHIDVVHVSPCLPAVPQVGCDITSDLSSSAVVTCDVEACISCIRPHMDPHVDKSSCKQ